MPLPGYSSAEFIGELAYSTNRFTSSYFVEIMTSTVADYVLLLLGDAAYIDIDSPTFKQKWTKLFSGGIFNGKVFPGMDKVLKYIVYFNLVRNEFNMSDTGAVRNKNENSTNLPQYPIAKDRFNKAVKYLETTYAAIKDLEFVYDCTSAPAVDGYLITIEVTSRTLLDTGDTVYVEGIPYTIANHTVITAGDEVTSETFEIAVPATTFTYKPYEAVVPYDLKRIVL